LKFTSIVFLDTFTSELHPLSMVFEGVTSLERTLSTMLRFISAVVKKLELASDCWDKVIKETVSRKNEEMVFMDANDIDQWTKSDLVSCQSNINCGRLWPVPRLFGAQEPGTVPYSIGDLRIRSVSKKGELSMALAFFRKTVVDVQILLNVWSMTHWFQRGKAREMMYREEVKKFIPSF